MNETQREIAGLNCHIVDALPEDSKPKLLTLICHGFGAPGTDLVSLSFELFRAFPTLQESVRFVFPEAPLSLDSVGMLGGRAWWMIDVERMMQAIETGEFRDLRNDCPDDLAACRERIMEVVETIRKEDDLSLDRIVLGGFSQGAMLMTDVALHLEHPPSGLCIFSGSLLCEEKWRTLAKERESLKVLQSHGYEDPILPYKAAEWLRDLFMESNFDVEFLPFHGEHTIPIEALEKFGEMLISCTC